MKKSVLFLGLFSVLMGTAECAWQKAAAKYPKLVLLIAIDQFRYDYLTRFREQYTGGLQRLLTRGRHALGRDSGNERHRRQRLV